MNDKVRENWLRISIWRDSIRTKLRKSPFWEYGLAVISTLIALVATYLLQPFVFRTPLFFLAIMMSAWIGGTKPGLLAVAIATLFISFVLSPDGIVPINFQNTPNIFAFLLTALLVCWWSLKRRQAEQDLEQARSELEVKVQERTISLRQINEQLQNEMLERKHAEASLRESELKYRSIFETAQDVLVLLDIQGNILDVNIRGEQILGYSKSELLSMNVFHNVYFSADRSLMREVIDDLVKGQSREYEARWIKKNGTVVHFAGTSAPRFSEAGEFLSTVCSLRDITERKQAEAALQKYTKRLETWHKIDEGILKAQSLEEIAKAVLNLAATLVSCQRAGIMLFDFENQQSTIYAAHYKGESRFASKGPITFADLWKMNEKLHELQQGQVLVIDDMHTLPPYKGIQMTIKEGIQSEIIVPLLVQGELIGTFDVGAEQLRGFGSEDVDIIREMANSLAIAIAQVRLFENMSKKKDQLRLLTQQLVEAQEIERRRLAQELHDRIGSNLTALSLNLGIIKNRLSPDVSANLSSQLDDSVNLVENTAEIIRDVTAELSSPVLEDYGLDAALRWYAHRFEQRAGVKVEIQVNGRIGYLQAEEQLALYRIAQEVLTNIAKHAKASQVTITEETNNQAFRLLIADNGIGFNMDDLHLSVEQRGLGLLSIRDRAESIGGQLNIQSERGHGTRVIIELKR